MKTSRSVTAFALIILYAVASPLPAQCPPEQVPIVSHYYTFYSDYFQTPVGGWSHTCEDVYDEWGSQTGAYADDYWEGCCGQYQTGRRCYQNNSGTWTQITCP